MGIYSTFSNPPPCYLVVFQVFISFLLPLREIDAMVAEKPLCLVVVVTVLGLSTSV
jgi:hypothetical protein